MPRFELSFDDPQCLHALFGELLGYVLDDARARHQRATIDVKQGPFAIWCNMPAPSDRPTWHLLEAAASAPSTLPVGWPKAIMREWPQLRTGDFPRILAFAIREAKRLGVEPTDCCRVIGCVVQTLRCMQEQPSHSVCSTCLNPRASIAVSHASHIGPNYAQKSENQDATRVVQRDSRVFFALADGVSTSLGSAYAAAQLTDVFCRRLSKLFSASRRDKRDLLRRAVLAAQATLDNDLETLLDDPHSPLWYEVCGRSRMPRESALRVLRNTLDPVNPRWAPQLASTLCGGVVELYGDKIVLDLIRVGDGVVESCGPHKRDTLLAMDANATSLETAISPGPLGREAVQRAEHVHYAVPYNTDKILISSDGLTRGHALTVGAMLERVSSRSLRSSVAPDDETVLRVLRRAAAHADTEFREGKSRDLFGDNLSLIVIDCNRRGLRR